VSSISAEEQSVSETPTWRERLELIAAPTISAPVRIAGVIAAVLVTVVVGWFLLRQPPAPAAESTLPRARPATATASTMPSELVVDAAGAVQSPGVYHLPAGSRIADLVDAAGGAGPDADIDRVNLAAPLADGQRVYVPHQGEPAPADDASSGPLDLNSATVEQLDKLPGIGPATARAIVDARTRKGRFTSVDDLLGVRGIGQAKLDALRGLVMV
jgi:competence protein ComEA